MAIFFKSPSPSLTVHSRANQKMMQKLKPTQVIAYWNAQVTSIVVFKGGQKLFGFISLEQHLHLTMRV
jgi:hypothetical protein